MSLIETKREVKIRVYTNCLHACARVEEGGKGGTPKRKGLGLGWGLGEMAIQACGLGGVLMPAQR